jgi:cytochrome b561
MNTNAPTPTARYTRVAIALHWLLAVMIIGAFCVGLYMHELPLSPTRLKLYNWHKWAGVTILALSALRLLWRLTHRPPAAASMPGWQTLAAHGAHVALYVLFFLVPLAGWAYSSASGFPVVLFGVWPLPDFVAPDRALAEVMKARHAQFAWALCGVVVLHVAAALKHHFIDKDGLLRRMRPA